MARIIRVLVLLFVIQAAAQDPSIAWQNSIGGFGTESGGYVIETDEGGYLLFGASDSNISGDKNENSKGFTDYWIIKLDQMGAIQWQNTIGGNGSERTRVVLNTQDGGFLLAGDSNSDVSGDKTEPSRGMDDYWLVKTDVLGQVEWDKTLGGSGHDVLLSAIQDDNGDYIVGGLSFSDISGDKTENSNGLADFWILKLSENGSIIWQNTIGGADSDIPSGIIAASDNNGYIIAGTSKSDISGDKTENSLGGEDYWIVKLSIDGNIIWQNTIGGSMNDTCSKLLPVPNSDGYVVIGDSRSPASGDKIENSIGGDDIWLMGLDSKGNIVWQNTIGGNTNESPSDISFDQFNNILIASWSFSPISGDKNEDSVDSDFWIILTDSIGNIIDQNTINADETDFAHSILIDQTGDYVISGQSESPVSGDKTEGTYFEGWDFWILKLTNFLDNPDYQQNEISLNPIPAQDILNLHIPESEVLKSLRIIDALGKVVIKFPVSANGKDRVFDVSSLGSGIYIVEMNISGRKVTRRFLKK